MVGTVAPSSLPSIAGRLGQKLPVGIEGAGVVVAVGEGAEHLMGRTVALFFASTYASYVRVAADRVMVLPEGTAARDGAAAFVNPLTALGMVETMRREGGEALVHTAAASNLGQMLLRLCLADGIDLVAIVRSDAQVALLREQGARHVLNSQADDFAEGLEEALAQTGARIAFDAIGGGTLASDILTGMERAQARGATGPYSRYGSSQEKKVHIYGTLDTSPTVLARKHGFAWSVAGWLLPNFLATLDDAARERLHARVAAELTTTFASHYKATVSLADLLDPETLRAIARKGTGEKYLIEDFS